MVSKNVALAMLVSVAVAIIASCSSKSSGGGGGGGDDGGTSSSGGGGLLANPGVTQTCQTCLSGASGNDCSAQAKTCTSDTNCVGLNTCVNKCTNLNQGCITNCGNAASVNAVTEWNGWFNCGCNDCASQCSACSGGSSSGGSSGSSSGSSSGGGSGSSSGGTTITCATDAQVQAVCTSGTGWYCTGPDNPQGDGISGPCSAPVADPSGVGTDYCCN